MRVLFFTWAAMLTALCACGMAPKPTPPALADAVSSTLQQQEASVYTQHGTINSPMNTPSDEYGPYSHGRSGHGHK